MLKKLIFLGAIIAIIPLDRERQAELYDMAKTTISDLSGFCQRNPGVCEKGKKTIGEMTARAEAGARMMAGLAMEQARRKVLESNDRHNAAPSPAAVRSAGEASSHFYGYQPSPAGTHARFPGLDDDDDAIIQPSGNSAAVSSNGTLNPADLEPEWSLR